MASVLDVLFKFLRILRVALQRFPGRGASLLSLIVRKFNALWRFCLGKPGASRSLKPAERPFFGTRTRPSSVSGSSAVVREYVIAASNVPASASHPTLHEHEGEGQQAVTAPTAVIPFSNPNFSVDESNTPIPFEGRNLAHRSSGNLSIQSRASDRFSIITTSRDSIRAPLGQPSRTFRATYHQHGRHSSGNLSIQSRASRRFSIITTSSDAIYVPLDQPSRGPVATHRQFGRGPDSSRSREVSRSPSPMAHAVHPQPPRVEIDTTDLPSPVNDDSTGSPVAQPSSSNQHEPLSPPPVHGHRRRQSLTSVIVAIQNPSTESFPLPTLANAPKLTDEPFAVDSPTAPSPPVSVPVDQYDEHSLFSSISSHHLPEGRFVQLIHSDQVLRYAKNITISREETSYDVKPLTTTFPYYAEPTSPEQDSLKQDCSPWIPATHPDGALYFYDPERRLFTDTDMHNPTFWEEMEDFYQHLQQILRVDQLSIPSKNYDLVLDIMATEDERISWSYYYACHDTRCLFWLETYDASYMISELFGVKSPAHVKHRLESLYWNHWSLYPVVFDNRRLPLETYDELMGILAHGCVDVLTSKFSTLPYDDDTMQKMIGLVQSAKKCKGGETYYTAGVTRLLSVFAHWRFLYFHGQGHARLIPDQSVYDKPLRERSILITLLSPLLFLAPEVRLREMEKLWTDEVIIQPLWENFMTKLLLEWNNVILWSTLMVTANVGFLAVPGVVLSNLNGSNLTSASQVLIFTSPSQIASILSVEASIGSIVIALLLVRRNRTKKKMGPAGASTYLFLHSHRIFGLEPMAVIFSLPWALLIWSMALFFIGLLLFCFTISNTPTRAFVTVLSAVAILLLGWCIRFTWKSTEDEYLWHNSLVVLRRTGDDLFRSIKQFGLDIFRSFRTRRVPPAESVRSVHLMGERQSGAGV